MAQRKTQNRNTRNNRNIRKRRKGRFGFLYKFICLILVCVAIVAGCIVFFKVERIEVEGAERYTVEQVTEASGVTIGENLFLINKFSVINRIFKALPYMDEIMIRRKLPDALVITVTECVPAAAVQFENGYWIIDPKGKLLENVDTPGTGYPVLTGLDMLSPAQGSYVTLNEEDVRESYYKSLLQELVNQELISDITRIDLTEDNVIWLYYKEQCRIKLESNSDFAYKISFLTQILETLQSNETGTIDMTVYFPRKEKAGKRCVKVYRKTHRSIDLG